MTRWIFAGFLIFAGSASAQNEVHGEHSSVRAFALQTSLPDGDLLEVGLDFTMQPEWHIYWKNPGDSGAEPKIDPQNAELVSWDWPAPARIVVPPLTNYGYSGRVVFPLRLRPAAGATDVELRLEWLVCKVECVPVFGTVKIPFARGPRVELSVDHPDRILFDQYAARVPLVAGAPEFELLSITDNRAKFRLGGLDPSAVRELNVFPYASQIFTTAVPVITVDGEDLRLELTLAPNRDVARTSTRAVLTLARTDGVHAYDVPMALVTPPPSLGRILLLAILGGLILNLMPCVFPVLALKVFGILKDPDRSSVRRSGRQYALGVVVSFLILGAVLLILRAGGEALGWGFQLQSPAFVLAMLVLFVLMALNFAGLFEIGSGVTQWAGHVSTKGPLNGSFGTGVLAVFVASPCTAPMMGPALGATLLLPGAASMAVFFALGIGLALPVLAISEWPRLARALPKPGAWMETFKQFMAFPMLATAAWLLWVLQFQTGPNFMLQTLFGLIFLTFAIWCGQKIRRPWGRVLVFTVGIFTVGWWGWQLRETHPQNAGTTTERRWRQFSPDEVAQARAAGAVFIDFTASWCITCQVNKLNVLNTSEVQSLFERENVALFQADWTDRDPVITAALAEFGRNSVPFYVYYPPGGGAQVLPEILTASMIHQLFVPKEEK